MGTTTEPTSALAAAVAAAAPTATTAAAAPARTDEQNVLIWPSFGPDPLDLSRVTVTAGVLVSGLGELVSAIVDSAIGGTSTASLTPDTVARAIYTYNESYLDVDHTDKIKAGLRRGTKFLWTPHDATTGNNLLSLPEAPTDW